jgi:hypothetical protein
MTTMFIRQYTLKFCEVYDIRIIKFTLLTCSLVTECGLNGDFICGKRFSGHPFYTPLSGHHYTPCKLGSETEDQRHENHVREIWPENPGVNEMLRGVL